MGSGWKGPRNGVVKSVPSWSHSGHSASSSQRLEWGWGMERRKEGGPVAFSSLFLNSPRKLLTIYYSQRIEPKKVRWVAMQIYA